MLALLHTIQAAKIAGASGKCQPTHGPLMDRHLESIGESSHLALVTMAAEGKEEEVNKLHLCSHMQTADWTNIKPPNSAACPSALQVCGQVTAMNTNNFNATYTFTKVNTVICVSYMSRHVAAGADRTPSVY